MNEEEEWRVLKSIAKCPSCGGDLEKGYAVAQAISFDTKKKRSVRGPKYILTKWPTWAVLTLPTLRCNQCHIVIIDYRGS